MGRTSRYGAVRRWGVAALLTLAAASTVAAVALEVPAEPYTDNTECLTCHATAEPVSWPSMPREDFSAPPVDRLTACWACHWRTASEHPHTTMNCGCHLSPNRPSVDWGSWPAVETASGWFHTTQSPDADAAMLHRIHLWPDGNAALNLYNVKCGSCHGRAACSACHGTVTHAVHPYALEPGSGGLSPWSGEVGVGTPVGDKLADGRRTEVVSCDIPECHPRTDLPKSQIKDRWLWEQNKALYADYGPVTLTGSTWGRWSGSMWLWGADFTREAGASVETTFTGSQIGIWGLWYPNAGAICDIYIDGSKVDTINTYNPVQGNRVIVWKSARLTEGVHTLRIVHTGVKLPAATDNIMLVDGFEVYSYTGPFVYKCADCHDEMTRQHTP